MTKELVTRAQEKRIRILNFGSLTEADNKLALLNLEAAQMIEAQEGTTPLQIWRSKVIRQQKGKKIKP